MVDHLVHRWPANIDLFVTALNHRLPVYFAPMADPASMGTDALLQCWDHLQAYAFPPFRLVRQVLNKFLESANCELTLNGSVVASTGMVSRSSESSTVPSGTLANSSGPPSATSFPSLPSQSTVAGSSRVEAVRRFACEWGVSSSVARQLANCHRPSLQRLYQHRWLAYRRWCRSKGLTMSSPSVAKIAVFCCF